MHKIQAINEIINYLFWKNVIPSFRSQKTFDEIDLSKKILLNTKQFNSIGMI